MPDILIAFTVLAIISLLILLLSDVKQPFFACALLASIGMLIILSILHVAGPLCGGACL